MNSATFDTFMRNSAFSIVVLKTFQKNVKKFRC